MFLPPFQQTLSIVEQSNIIIISRQLTIQSNFLCMSWGGFILQVRPSVNNGIYRHGAHNQQVEYTQGAHKKQAESRVNASLTNCRFTFSCKRPKGFSAKKRVENKSVLAGVTFFDLRCSASVRPCFLVAKLKPYISLHVCVPGTNCGTKRS